MRNTAYPVWMPDFGRRALSMFYAVSQVLATFSVLFRDEAAAFWVLLPIQLAPLLMTLEKKGLLSQTGWHALYSAALLYNFHLGVSYGPCPEARDLMPVVAAVVFARMALRMDKYVVWGSVIAYYKLGHLFP